jgi:hypothetical protein
VLYTFNNVSYVHCYTLHYNGLDNNVISKKFVCRMYAWLLEEATISVALGFKIEALTWS